MSARHRISANGALQVEVVNVKNRREVMLERPPFCRDKHAWKAAVDKVRELKRGGARGEPFLLATQIYTQLGGTFL